MLEFLFLIIGFMVGMLIGGMSVYIEHCKHIKQGLQPMVDKNNVIKWFHKLTENEQKIYENH